MSKVSSSLRSSNTSYLAAVASDNDLMLAVKRNFVMVGGKLCLKPEIITEHLATLQEEVSNKVILEVGKKVYIEFDNRIGSQDAQIAGLRSDLSKQATVVDNRMTNIERDLGGLGQTISTSIAALIPSMVDLMRKELKAALQPGTDPTKQNV